MTTPSPATATAALGGLDATAGATRGCGVEAATGTAGPATGVDGLACWGKWNVATATGTRAAEVLPSLAPSPPPSRVSPAPVEAAREDTALARGRQTAHQSLLAAALGASDRHSSHARAATRPSQVRKVSHATAVIPGFVCTVPQCMLKLSANTSMQWHSALGAQYLLGPRSHQMPWVPCVNTDFDDARHCHRVSA